MAQTCLAAAEVLVPEGLLLVGMLIVTSVLDWRLTIVALSFLPVLTLVARRRNARVRRSQEPAREAAGRVTSHAVDVFTRVPVVHLFDAIAQERGMGAALSGDSARSAVRAVDAGARFGPAASLLPALGLAAAMAVGTMEVGAGRLSIGGLLVFLAYLGSLQAPVQRLTRLGSTLSRGNASRQRVINAAQLPPVSTRVTAHRRTTVRRVPPSAVPQAVRVDVERLAFRHDPQRLLFERLDLTLEPGSTTCLTGASGIGKSTLLSLLTRLVEPDRGRVLVDGVDVRDLTPAALHSLVAVVPQQPWLHSGSIRDNITYGRPDLTTDAVERAVEIAGVDAVVRALPAGLGTPVGSSGHQLSGGQQRRIAIARALVRQTPLLLLDEPTTGLDHVTAIRVMTDLLRATAGATVLIVTHDVRLTRMADTTLTLHLGGSVTAYTSPGSCGPLGPLGDGAATALPIWAASTAPHDPSEHPLRRPVPLTVDRPQSGRR